MIDSDGYRPNVGIMICNEDRRLFWARRLGQNAWQFPQGGIRVRETPEEAMYRELEEEVGLQWHHVEVLGCTHRWLRYRLPKRFIRRNSTPLCIGQKQKWFLLRLAANEEMVRLDSSSRPEFDRWCWVDYWRPPAEVISFKRNVYAMALQELAGLLFPEGLPPAEQPESLQPPLIP